MSDVKLGKLIDNNAVRDAVHFALAPVVAACQLWAGVHIGLDNEGKACIDAKKIGIVDPFFQGFIEPGERFYMILYPNTVKGMRHEWRHPSFPEDISVEKSELWLRQYIEFADCPSYEDIITAIKGEDMGYDSDYYSSAYELNNDYFHFNGRDAHGDIPDEFWDHIEIVTGIKVSSWERPGQWSCSC